MTHPEVTAYLDRAPRWSEEMKALRAILLELGLVETYKWRTPCYTHHGKNVAIIGAFKSHCNLSFLKGAILSDPDGLLQLPGPNSQAARVLSFTALAEIKAITPAIYALVQEAIDKYDHVVAPQTDKQQLTWPTELVELLAARPECKVAFEALTPGRQRAYLMHFAGAKQSKTRLNRIEKYLPRILKGKGINDCVCGLSQRMPNCDGSHKQLGGLPQP